MIYDSTDVDKKILPEEQYKPQEQTMKFIYGVYDKLIRWRSLRDQPYRQFNLQPLLEYLADARSKFWGYSPISFDQDTPTFFFPETRNQIIQILAKIANLRIKPSFEGVMNSGIILSTILRGLFGHWLRSSNRKVSNFWQFLYNIINGTVIVFTAYKSNVRDVRTITMYDPATGETAYKEEKFDESDVEDVICNLEDIYIPKIWEPNLQKQNEIIWRTLMKYGDFKDEYKGYPNVDKVCSGAQMADSSIFRDFLSQDVWGYDFVEVIKYFNKATDQYAIIANGVLMNGMMVKGEEEITPLPWNHKQLPFSKTIFEPIDANFFYGMPLAQKVKSPQEALNMMWELMLEREIRSVTAPIITNDPSVELGLEFKAGRVYQVQADVNQFKEMGVSPSSPSLWNALTSLQGIIQRTGSGGAGPTGLPSRQPRSATENSQNAEMQKEASGLYFLFYQDLLEQKVWLTMKNMIQFYTSKTTKERLGDREFNKIISIAESPLYGGGLGTQEIRITESPMPGTMLKKESYLRSLLKKERVDIIETTPAALRKVEFDIKLAFEVENSPEAERGMFLDYIMTITRLFGNTGLLSMKKMLYRTVEKFNESLSDVVEDKVEMEYEQERFGIQQKKQMGMLEMMQALQNPQQQPQGMTPGSLPNVNNSNQQLRGMQFGGEARNMAEQPQGEAIMQKF